MNKTIKNIMIFGDSYSTFTGYIPDGYAVYYTPMGRPETDVTKVEETWWHRVCTDLELNLVLNNSWSGSTLCNTGYQGDCSQTKSFLHRLDVLKEEGFFTAHEIDTVFIFGCTNDSWANAPLGEIGFDHWTKEDLACVCPAICCFIGRIRETLPDANVVFIINTDLKPQIGEAVKAASEHYGTSCIEMKTIDKRSGHPTIQGMKDIADQVEAFVRENM